MRALITGASGQVGAALKATAPAERELICLSHADLDITDEHAVHETFERADPEVVINAAAYTAVDRAEDEKEKAYAVNADGAAHVARSAFACGCDLIHISTDYVFDGESSRPYLTDDPVGPRSVYGASKLEGERHVEAVHPGAVILRTSWIYAAGFDNFVHTMLRLMDEKDALNIVADEVGAPTWATSLSQIIWRFAERRDLAGIWHYSDKGAASRYEFTREIQRQALSKGLLSREIPIEPITAEQYPTRAPRPRYSVLDIDGTEAALGIQAPLWPESLARMLDEVKRKNG